ncbi:MAG: AAA family ATPase, partial [Candidatus Thermoplasmatota archaeon]
MNYNADIKKYKLDVFDETYIPDRIKFRDDQIQRLKFYYDDYASTGARVPDIALQGAPATGKTVCIKHVLSSFDSRHILYTVAQETTYKTLVTIGRQLDLRLPLRGLSVPELLDMVWEKLDERNIRVLALDDVDKVKDPHLEEIFYKFSRGDKALTVLTNYMLFKQRIRDVGVQSSYNPIRIFFPP